MYFINSLRVFLLTILFHSSFSSLSFQYAFVGTKNVGTWSRKLSYGYCSLTTIGITTFSQIKKFSEDSAHSWAKKVINRPKSESRILVWSFTVQRQLSDNSVPFVLDYNWSVLCCKENFTFLEFHERYERYRVYPEKTKNY